MPSLQLFDLVSRHNQWLSVRQSAIAGNIANANTPGFKAQDVLPFEDVMKSTALAMRATQPGHLASSPAEVATTEVANEDAWETTHSGNSVSMDQELIKASEVNRSYALNTNVAKAFHRMLMMSSKG